MIYSDSQAGKMSSGLTQGHGRSRGAADRHKRYNLISSTPLAVPGEGDFFMLKRRHIHAVLIVLLAFLGVAQAQQAAPAQPKPRRFLMWKATSPSATVYLVGSIHVGNSGMYPLPKEVESAFAAAKVLAVEINIKNADQAKMIGLIQK